MALLISFILPTPCNDPFLKSFPVSPPGPWLMSQCKHTLCPLAGTVLVAYAQTAGVSLGLALCAQSAEVYLESFFTFKSSPLHPTTVAMRSILQDVFEK